MEWFHKQKELRSNLFRNCQSKTELLRNVPALDSAEVKMKVIEREGMDTAIVIVAVILPTLLVGVFGYFAYLVDGAERERR
jgi:hypothetical protein